MAATSLAPVYGGPAYSVSRLAVALAEIGVQVGLWSSDGSVMKTSLIPSMSSIERLSGNADDALSKFPGVQVVHDNGIWLPHNHRIASLAAMRSLPRVASTRGMLEPWAINHKRLKKRVAWTLYQKGDLKRAQCLHALR